MLPPPPPPAPGAPADRTPTGLVPVGRAVLDPNGRAFKAEGFADLVLQKTLIRKVQLHCAISEQDERGRRGRRLRDVLDANAFRRRHRGALEIHLLEEAVHLTGSYTLTPLGSHVLEL